MHGPQINIERLGLWWMAFYFIQLLKKISFWLVYLQRGLLVPAPYLLFPQKHKNLPVLEPHTIDLYQLLDP